MSKTQIDILRHGEPEGGRKYRGHGIDDPLSELGWRQMWAAIGDDWPWELILSSPMMRCRAFAEALAVKSGLALEFDTRLKEVGFGDWEGRTGAQLRKEAPESLRLFYENPVDNRPSNAEPLADFRERVGSALKDMLRLHQGRRVLVVAHAGVMRAAVSWLLDAPLERMYRIDIPNAAILRIAIRDERPPMIALDGPVL